MKPPPDDPMKRNAPESDLPVEEQARLRLKALEALKKMKEQQQETLPHGKESEGEDQEGG